MSGLVPAAVPLPAATDGDPRLGHLLGRALAPGTAPRAVLVGFPSDAGVRINGGRPGAAEGPSAIRRSLYRLTPDAGCPAHRALIERTVDLGDVSIEGDLEAAQQALAKVLAPVLSAGAFAIVLGGGHETAYGHFLAYALAGRTVALLNWDAHTDVRPTIDGQGHSGSPFRQALEHPSRAATRYTVAGVQPHSAAEPHLAYVRARGRVVPRRELSGTMIRELYAQLASPALVSFDLDLVDQAAAPGVSAPGVDGIDVPLWLEAARGAGRCPAVASADIVELSPPHDLDGRTARLAARTVWEILRGVVERPGG